MAKILKHFGLGNKKSSSSPVHKCKIETESPKISSKSNNNKYPNQQKSQQDSGTKDDDSNNSPTSPLKSPSESLGKMSSDIPDKTKNGVDMSRMAYEDPNIPVYSAVIKENKITPDSILNEIASKLNIADEKSNEPMSTFGKSSYKADDVSDRKSTTAAADKLPDVIKADCDTDCRPIEYDDPYEEGPIRLSQPISMSHQIDSGVSSTKSSTTTLNMINDSDDTLEKPKKQTMCTGETQIGFDTLRSWNLEKPKRQNVDGLSISEGNDDETGDYDNDTLEGKPVEPPPIPAKTYNLANELPPPPPNLLETGGDFESISRPPVPARMSMSIQPDHDAPLDLSGGKIMNSRGNKSDTWCRPLRYEDDHLPMPCGPAPEPPMRDQHYKDGQRGSSDVRPHRHESLMMRSAYGMEHGPNYMPNQYYYSQQQPPPSHMPTPQQAPVRHHYRSGSVRSVDYRPGVDYDEPWDQQQQQQQAFTWQTAPDNMRCSYNVMPRHPQYNSRTSLTSASWGPNYPAEPIDPRIPLEEQFWFHGGISRVDTENILRMQREGSYLVRTSESNRYDYSLSVKSTRGFMHMKITPNQDGRYILGQFSQPFASIPHMIQHYTIHKLPIKGAEHMSLLYPIGNDML